MQSFKQVILAATALAAMPSTAHAADYLTYSFDVSGYATRDRQESPAITYHRQGFLDGKITLVVPVSKFGGFTYNQTFGPSYAVDSLTGILSATGFDVAEAALPYPKGPSRFLALDACGAFGGLSGSFSVAVNPLCSAVSFYRGEPTVPGLAGDGASFAGTVTRLTVTEGFGRPAAYGFVNAPVLPVPEPATWAMMILGLGAIGVTARRRRAGTHALA